MRLETYKYLFKLSYILHHTFVTEQILKKVFLVASSKQLLLNKYPKIIVI